MSRKQIVAVTAIATALTAGGTAMTFSDRDTGVRAVAERSPRTPAATAPSGSAEAVREVLADAGLTVPEGWRVAHTRTERHDDVPVTLVRFEQDGRRTLGGEHVSAVVAEDGRLLGYTRMVTDAPAELLPEERARQVALTWLQRHAPEYARGLDVQWVQRHDERVRAANGRERVISGMKVKAHHVSGLYAWVIVDGAGQVLTYERDVRWDGPAGRRGTQMWLHDAWVAAREGTGPQPDAPYAVA